MIEKRHYFTLGDVDVIIGPKWGALDPYVPKIPQILIKVIKGNKVIEASFEGDEREHLKNLREFVKGMEDFLKDFERIVEEERVYENPP